MNRWPQTLQHAVELAAPAGNESAPDALVAHSEQETDPIAALADLDLANALFGALDEDIGFVLFARRDSRPISEENFQRLVETIRWLDRELANWAIDTDPKLARLSSVFVLASRLDEDGLLWRFLPDAIGHNDSLNLTLANFLARSRLVMSRAGFSHSPILDQEMLDGFLQAERDQNWAAARRHTEQVPFSFFGSVALTQSVRFLKRFKPELLVAAVRPVPQIGLAMQIVSAVSIEDGFQLARDSGNPYLQFASVCRLFASHTPVRHLTPSEEDALTLLLLVISRDPRQWAAWMKAFNAYPNQSPVIQQALGRCLAEADDTALAEYIRAVVLSLGAVGRDVITVCLASFADRAPLEKRCRLWQMAFRHWSAWNFGEHDNHSRPTSIGVSPIDFAIVGYALDCLNAAEREQVVAQDLQRLQEAETMWHGSSVEAMAYFFRTLSHLQPFAHAQACPQDRPRWLMAPNHLHLPDYLRNDLYYRLRYHMDNLKLKDLAPAA